MPRTPKRLYGPALPATGPATVYTVPAATKTIVRQIHVNNPNAAVRTYSISLGADAAGTRLWTAYSIPAAAAGVTDNVRDHFMYLPMEATEVIQISVSNADINITITGDEFTLG